MNNNNYEEILKKLNEEKMANPNSQRVLQPHEQEAIFLRYEDLVKESHDIGLMEMLEESRYVVMGDIDKVAIAKTGRPVTFFGDGNLLSLYAHIAQLDDYQNAIKIADYQYWSADEPYPAINYLSRKLRKIKERYGVN